MTKFLTPLLTLAVLSLASCGGEEPTDKGGKGGDGKGNKAGDQNTSQPANPMADLAGTWTLETDRIMELNPDLAPAGATDEMIAMIAKQMASMTMSITLNADGSASSAAEMPMMGEKMNAAGSWELDGMNVSISMKKEGEEEPETIKGSVDGDRLVLASEEEGPMKSMSFKRQ